MKLARIVLVEDNPADVILVSLALNESHIEHTLLQYESGVTAVRELCAHADSVPDAILLDLHTPMADGFGVASQLRESFAGVPITVLTSSRARSDKETARRLGIGYLEKPSQLNDFIEQVGAAVRTMLAARHETS